MNDIFELNECVCENIEDLDHLLACGIEDAMRSKSRSILPKLDKQRLTRREQQVQWFEMAKQAVRMGDPWLLGSMIKTPKQANGYASDTAWSLLDEAVKVSSSQSVKWLLQHGANPNTLFWRDKLYDHRKGVEPGWYFSPFASAIRLQNQEVIKLMMGYGADLNLPVVCAGDRTITTCGGMAKDCGMWPQIEAILISQSLPATTASSNTQRL